jgi:cytoskeletal protein RodZ
MKRFDNSASQLDESDAQASYFSNGLLAKIIHNDQSLARPTEQVQRRRWIERMVLAEIAFVIGVVLLQFFPTITATSADAAVAPTPTATTLIAAATSEPEPAPSQSAAIIVATTTAAQPRPSSEPTAAPTTLPAALPNTGAAAALTPSLLFGALLCIGGGLLLWLIAGALRAGRSADQGSGV